MPRWENGRPNGLEQHETGFIIDDDIDNEDGVVFIVRRGSEDQTATLTVLDLGVTPPTVKAYIVLDGGLKAKLISALQSA
jgi:hypothetical protein